MTSLSSFVLLRDQAGQGPVPFPAPHSQVAGSALQPTYELWGKGGTPQNQARDVPHGRRGRPVQAGGHSGGLGRLAAVGLPADSEHPERAQELVGDRDVGLLLLERSVVTLGQGQKAGLEIGVVEDERGRGLVGEEAEQGSPTAVDAAGGLLLAGVALSGGAAGKLDHAAGVVEPARVTAEGEQVVAHDLPPAAYPPPQPTQSGVVESGRHLLVEAADRDLASLVALGGQMEAESDGRRLIFGSGQPRSCPEAAGHPGQEAPSVLSSQSIGKGLPAEIADLKRREGEAGA